MCSEGAQRRETLAAAPALQKPQLVLVREERPQNTRSVEMMRLIPAAPGPARFPREIGADAFLWVRFLCALGWSRS